MLIGQQTNIRVIAVAALGGVVAYLLCSLL